MENQIVCTGKKNIDGTWYYMNFDFETFAFKKDKNCLDPLFNEKKYDKYARAGRVYTALGGRIYTALGVVEDKDLGKEGIYGYLLADNKGNLFIETEEDFISILKKNLCMNYTIRKTNNKYVLCKNPNVMIKSFKDEEIKEKLGICFKDMSLQREMTLNGIDFAMFKHGFKPGYIKDFRDVYFGEDRKARQIIYYNSEGVIICLNLIETQTPGVYTLNYFHNSCFAECIVDSDKYRKCIQKGLYIGMSTIPVGEDKSGNTILKLIASNYYEFFRFVKVLRKFSKPCKPFISEKGLGFALEMFQMTPEQSKEKEVFFSTYLKDLESKCGYSKHKYSILYTALMGYQNVIRYDEDLLKFYSNILADFERRVKEYTSDMDKKYVDLICRHCGVNLR